MIKRAIELSDGICRERAQPLLASDPPAADPMAIVQQLVQCLRRDGAGIVRLPLRFLDDHLELAAQLFAVDQRSRVRVCLDFEAMLKRRGREDRVVARVIVDRPGIQVAAQRLGLLRDLADAARGRALEEHVLEHVGDADHVIGFVEVARADVGDDRHDRRRRIAPHDDRESIRQAVAPDAFRADQSGGTPGAGAAAWQADHGPLPARVSHCIASCDRLSLTSAQPSQPCDDLSPEFTSRACTYQVRAIS
jgi:hypothetical protein